jgi:hypothetical protein
VYERNPYAGRYRVEEDKFPEVPCNVTRIASSAGGKCLQGYRLRPGLSLFAQRGGLKCDMALDVVMYRAGNLSIEASTVIFDPYKLAATGLPGKYCHVASQPGYDQEDFQDMNQVTTNLRGEPMDMWTIGFADRLRFPRFPSQQAPSSLAGMLDGTALISNSFSVQCPPSRPHLECPPQGA